MMANAFVRFRSRGIVQFVVSGRCVALVGLSGCDPHSMRWRSFGIAYRQRAESEGVVMSTETKTEPQRIAEQWVDELQVLQRMVDAVGNACISRSDLEELEANQAEFLSVFDELGDGDSDAEGDSVWFRFIGQALDVEIDGRFSLGRWEVTEVALLMGCGGPTVRVCASDNGGVNVWVWWGSESASRWVECDLASVLLELGESIVSNG